MKSKVGSHNCIVWIFQQLSVLLRIKRVVLIAVYGRLCMVGLFTTSLISSPTILPTHHSAPPYFGILSVLQRCQAHSFKTYLPYLAQSAFCSEWFLFWETNFPNQNFTPPGITHYSLTLLNVIFIVLITTCHFIIIQILLSVGFFVSSTGIQVTQGKGIRLKDFPTLFPVMSTLSDTWKMPVFAELINK